MDAMRNVIEQFSSGWGVPLGMVVIIAPLLVKVVQEFPKARIHLAEIEAKPKKITAELQTDIHPCASNVVNNNFNILEKYYDQTLAENRLLSREAYPVVPGSPI